MASRRGEDSELLERLYPVPLSTGVVALPGPTSASSSALLSVLKDNRENHHIFFNDKGYHKYVEIRHSERVDIQLMLPKVMQRTTYWPSTVLAPRPKS
jgi:hypothetical protein